MRTLLTPFVFAALALGTFAPFSDAQTLTSDEKKIVEFIDNNNAAAISLLEKTVDIESPTEDLAGVKDVGMVFGKEFEALGMKTRWIDMPAAQKRAGHLIAETSGKKGKRILIIELLLPCSRGS